MDLNLAERNIIVFGGSGGIGYAIAEALLAEQADIVLASRNEENLRAAANELRDRGEGSVAFHKCDYGDSNSIRSFLEWISLNVKQVDGIDC